MREAEPLSSGLRGRVADGPGEGILWIHGYTLDSSLWEELWALLPRWRHVGVDLPGHGASAGTPLRADLPGLARELGALAREHRLQHVVGLSFGGTVALQLGIEHPRDFASFTLAAAAVVGGPQDPAAQACNLELARLFAERGPGPWLGERWLRSPPDIFRGAEARPRLRERLERVVSRHGWKELNGGGMQGMMASPQSVREMSRIRASTLVILGEEDMGAFKRCGDIIRRSVPGARRRYLSGAGHLALLERPEVAAPLLAEHLTTATTATGRGGRPGDAGAPTPSTGGFGS